MLALTVDEAISVFRHNDTIQRSLSALASLGLGYLTLGQPATELSGGECQRIKLAWELRRVQRGDTVVMAEHDMRIACEADWVLDLGPGSGVNGGQIVATGTPEDVSRAPDSLTAPYLLARLEKRTGDPEE